LTSTNELPLRLTVGIATRNRPESLIRCVTSLALLGDLVSEVIIVDDASDPPVRAMIDRLPAGQGRSLRVIEQPAAVGYIAGRNRMVREASNECILSMDDDAFILEAAGVSRAARMLALDPGIAAVAFSQAGAEGTRWSASMQPAPATYPCYVTSYIGFAHLVRRSAFLDVGGYDESFFFYGEEKDWCLRALDVGSHVVYLPDVAVAHVPDLSGRNSVRYIRHVVRNDCLSALRHEPWPLPLISLPARLARYFPMRRNGGISDPGGFSWLLREVAAAVPGAVFSRRVRWRTWREWRRIRREWPPYSGPALP
jgi:GT2 family glycosyltransferase